MNREAHGWFCEGLGGSSPGLLDSIFEAILTLTVGIIFT